LLPDEWLALIGNSSISQYSFLLPDKYFFNSSAMNNLFDGTFSDFEYLVKDDLTLEKGLAVTDMAMHIFYKYIQPLQQAQQDVDYNKLEDLKAIFGNATALDLLFSQGISGYTPNTSHRYIVTQYADIVQEAKQFFLERVLYWTNITNGLL
jgi:hypothetical protein